jgi:hypothetical protein
MTEFETPLMRDLYKVLLPILYGVMIGIALLFVCCFPFSMTVYGYNCMEMSQYSIAEYIVRSLTIQC